MKVEEQKEARRLRSDEAISIGEIAARLKVSNSSVSRWVRGICLTDEQIARLMLQNPIYNRQLSAIRSIRERSRERRRAYQEEGRRRAREGDPVHMAGCMLYWAEGSKDRNAIAFTNSDPSMMAFFLSFIRSCYHIEDNEITLHVHCYADNGSVKAVETFWLQRLTTLNRYSRQSQHKRCNKLAYGICRLRICRTDVVQRIYGAIQEYAGVEADFWLD